ncbi:MAG: hypothetical protein Q8R47_05345 [Nanoarchaeota archaeon]|nr:hypothetical protein [Nanoarchaeota archaeon]
MSEFHETYNKIRAFVFTPVGLVMTGKEIYGLLDKENGNASFFYLAVGLYLVGRGVTGAMNLYGKSDLENKVDEE